MTALAFVVRGVPVTQGSAKGFVVGDRAIVTASNNKTLKPWREAIRSDAVAHLGQREPLTGPVVVTLTFALPKPKSAPKTRRTFPIGKRSGDIDKLVRACFDALTDAGVWGDDAQVVSLVARKDYPTPDLPVPGVHVHVAPFV